MLILAIFVISPLKKAWSMSCLSSFGNMHNLKFSYHRLEEFEN
jgi:hypothetical protein